MEGGGHDEDVASSKEKTNSRLECKNRYPIYDQNGAKIIKNGQNRYSVEYVHVTSSNSQIQN